MADDNHDDEHTDAEHAQQAQLTRALLRDAITVAMGQGACVSVVLGELVRALTRGAFQFNITLAELVADIVDDYEDVREEPPARTRRKARLDFPKGPLVH